MKRARSWTTAEERRNPVKEPRRINRESRKQRENEEDRNGPVQETRVNRMPQQLTTMNPRGPEPRKFAPGPFVKIFCG